jgi:hypothetical protein
MPKVKLTRQVTDGNVVLAPGEHEVPDELAAHYQRQGWAEDDAHQEKSAAPQRTTRKDKAP